MVLLVDQIPVDQIPVDQKPVNQNYCSVMDKINLLSNFQEIKIESPTDKIIRQIRELDYFRSTKTRR